MQQLKRAFRWRPAVAVKLVAARAGVGVLLRRALRWWFALAVILVAAGVGVRLLWIRKGESETGNLDVFAVERGNLVAAVSCTGEVYAPRKAELSFDVSKISLIELNVAPGQLVKAGDALARIDPTTLERAVTQAEAELTAAQENLEGAQNPYTELDLTRAGLAVSQAHAALDDAKKSLEKARDPYTELDVIRAGLAVTQAHAALADSQENLEAVLSPDIEAAQMAIGDAAAALKSAQNQLIVAQNESDNAAKLRTLEYEAIWYRNNYWAAQEKFRNGQIDQQKLDWEHSNMLAAQEKLNAARAKAESSLANANNQVTKAQEAYQEAKDHLAELQDGPDPTELALAQTQVVQCEYDLAQAREDLAGIEAGPDPSELTRAQNQVAQAEYNVAKAQADLAEIEAGPAPKDIEVAQTRAASAQAALEEAQAALEAATMIAPFDGTVISVGAQVGDLVSSNTIIVTLADLSNLRVKAIVDETDISPVEIGQEVETTFDAFPGYRFRGQVLEVPLQGQLTQNILTYEVPVSLEGEADVSPKPGMTANVRIVVGRRENVLLVPAMAVQWGEEGNVVWVQDSPQGPPFETQVVLGLSDAMYVEVRLGLNEGDRVVVQHQPPQEGEAGFRRVQPVISTGGRGMR